MKTRSYSTLELPFPPITEKDSSPSTAETKHEAETQGMSIPLLDEHAEFRTKPEALRRGIAAFEKPSVKKVGNLSLSLSFPDQPAADPSAPLTLADLMKRIGGPTSLHLVDTSSKTARNIGSLRTTAKHIAKMFKRSADRISIEELVSIDQKLIAFLTATGLSRIVIGRYVLNSHKLLAHARDLGWSSKSLAVRESWDLISTALRGASGGCQSIVQWAIAHGIPASRFGEQGMKRWRQEMKQTRRSPITIQGKEASFRKFIRKAKLEHLLPQLNLAPRGRTRYRKDGSSRPVELEADIAAKVEWKSAPLIGDRDAKYRVRPATAKDLRQLLRQICDYAECELGMRHLHSLKEVLVQEVLCPMIDWLRKTDRRKPKSIQSAMARIHALLMQHPDFNKAGESEQAKKDRHFWLSDKVKELVPESKEQFIKRKNSKSIPYSELTKVPLRIEEAIAITDDELKIAWLKHDLLFFRWTLHHPWRGRNLRECSVEEREGANIIHEPLPLDLQRSQTLPPWAVRRLRKNNEAPFVRVVFDEECTKANHLVEELVARELLPLYREYVDKHRPKLIESGRKRAIEKGKENLPEPETLFLNRRLCAMNSGALIRLYARLTEQYIGRRSTPHLNRDSFSEHHLDTGGTFAALQRALWHVSPETTWKYCRRFNPSNGAVVLDRFLVENTSRYQ